MQLAARRFEVLNVQLEKEKAVLLGHLDLVEELAWRLIGKAVLTFAWQFCR